MTSTDTEVPPFESKYYKIKIKEKNICKHEYITKIIVSDGLISFLKLLKKSQFKCEDGFIIGYDHKESIFDSNYFIIDDKNTYEVNNINKLEIEQLMENMDELIKLYGKFKSIKDTENWVKFECTEKIYNEISMKAKSISIHRGLFKYIDKTSDIVINENHLTPEYINGMLYVNESTEYCNITNLEGMSENDIYKLAKVLHELEKKYLEHENKKMSKDDIIYNTNNINNINNIHEMSKDDIKEDILFRFRCYKDKNIDDLYKLLKDYNIIEELWSEVDDDSLDKAKLVLLLKLNVKDEEIEKYDEDEMLYKLFKKYVNYRNQPSIKK